MKRFLTLLKIEGKIAVRGIDGIFFGVFMPVGIAILIGFICGDKPAYEGAAHTFLEASFPALITVGICATAFMGIPLGLSDYRDKKILKHFFVTPVSPMLLLMVQVAINFLNSLVSATAILLVMKFVFGYRMRGSKIGFLFAYILVLISMYALGMMLASLCRTLKVANLVCTLIYFPMLFLSGATIPYEILPQALQKAANILPLTQGIKLLKGFSMGTGKTEILVPSIIMITVAAAGIIISIKKFRWE